ncbi:MAG: iron-sulfur cluster assembly accessory protein [Gammaproteobacteria bacterium]|nr:iron-sulfur cluster assembly accessory protein [Gammaproteobacteria bacterium]
MAVVLTENALNRVRSFSPGAAGLRIGVKRTGCSGLAYVVNHADPVTAGDVVFDQDGVRVVVDQEALQLIDGTVVDFVREGLNEAFRFSNPNAKGECGCGESFTV